MENWFKNTIFELKIQFKKIKLNWKIFDICL